MGATVAYGGGVAGMFSSIRIIRTSRDRDIDLHSVSETAIICIDLSSAGSKSRPARWGLKRHPSPPGACAQAKPPRTSRGFGTSSFKGWHRRIRKLAKSWHIGRSRNSESQRGALQENSPYHCEKPNSRRIEQATCRQRSGTRCLHPCRSIADGDSGPGRMAVAAVLAVRCIMRLSKPAVHPKSVAPKHWEYMDTLNNALTCVVFVPIFLFTWYATPLARHGG